MSLNGNVATLNKSAVNFKPKKKRVKGDYPKATSYYKQLDLWEKIGKKNPRGMLLPIPLGEGEKSPVGSFDGLLNGEKKTIFKPLYSKQWDTDNDRFKLWTAKKLRDWVKFSDKEPPLIEQTPNNLGILLSGDYATLDFDCEKDWNWFSEQFGIKEDNEYFIFKNLSKHKCDCDTDQEYTRQLFFKRDRFWLEERKTKINCIHIADDNGDMKPKLIDFLVEAENGTPHIIKVPEGGNDSRQWTSTPSNYVIKELPTLLTHYFYTNWRRSQKERNAVKRNYMVMDLANVIPVPTISNNDFVRMTYEMLGCDIDPDTIKVFANKLREDETYPNRIGCGLKSYTDTEHNDWVSNLLTSYEFKINRLQEYPTIKRLADTEELQAKYISIRLNSLKHYGEKFNTRYLWDVKEVISDVSKRGCFVMNYYNHFFIKTSGGKKASVYQLEYDKDGSLSKCYEKPDMANFKQFSKVEMVMTDEGKPVNTAKWWLDYGKCSYDTTEYIPYGILPSKQKHINSDIFNIFTGYNMKYVEGYDKPDNDKYGDLIDRHIKTTFCWAGGSDPLAFDEHKYHWFMKWIYMLVCLGVKPCVAIILYSEGFGYGKSLFTSNFLEFVIGKKNGTIQGNFKKMVEDQFTEYYENSSLMVLEEMPDNSNNEKGWDFMKTLTTEKTMTGRKMYNGAEGSVPIWLSFMINTNHFWGIPADYIRRRGHIVKCNDYFKLNDYSGGPCEGIFDKIYEAVSKYEGWENWIHRYVIGNYNQFKHIEVSPTENKLPVSKVRQDIMRRGADSILYYFKEKFEQFSADNYAGLIGKYISVEDLFIGYKCYKEENGFEMEKSCKTREEFLKRLSIKFGVETKMARKSVKKGIKDSGAGSDKNKPVMKKVNIGNVIVMEKWLIDKIMSQIKDKTITTDADSFMDMEEGEEVSLCADWFKGIEGGSNDLDFMD